MIAVTSFLTTREAAERIGISKSTLLRRLHRNDDVPKVVQVDKHVLRWRADDVDAWVQTRTRGQHRNDEVLS